MPEPKLYQIYYSEQSRAALDPGFLPLDNSANERPDWREYWPMRRFLLESQVEPDTYYGFFSPKFREKTGLDASAVRRFIEQQGSAADVIAFSPFFDQIAFPLSIMEQAIGSHGECLETLRQCAAMIAPGFEIARSVTTSVDTVFCNYFAAKPAFWSEWLRQCERIYQLAEESAIPLGMELNRTVSHGTGTAPLKVFVIERVATLLLWAQRNWVVRSCDPAQLPLSPSPLAKLLSLADLSMLDALKIAYERSGFERFLSLYAQLRGKVLQRASATERQAAEPAPAARSSDSPTKVRIVCATRKPRDDFFAQTALGRSLSLHRPSGVELRLFSDNDRGLSEVYNLAIEESAKEDLALLFMHDDLHLCDFHWADSLRQGLGAFDIVGVAGNRRRISRQPSWLFVDERLTPDSRDHLSGTVGHGRSLPLDAIDVFGPSGQPVKLLDGLFLAVRSGTLRSKSLRFDERFDFHFYDLDFCRQAEQAGLRMGTWPISVVHESIGGFLGEAWRSGYESYLEKWGD